MTKKIFVLFLFISGFAFSQMPNIYKVWLNDNQYYNGSISEKKVPLKLKIEISNQDHKNDQEYFVSGLSIVEKNLVNFEGKMKITSYKNGKKIGKVFGEYDFSENPSQKHSGTLKGRFIYTFKWNKDTQNIESPYLEFIGNWTSYDGKYTHKTNWKNQ